MNAKQTLLVVLATFLLSLGVCALRTPEGSNAALRRARVAESRLRSLAWATSAVAMLTLTQLDRTRTTATPAPDPDDLGENGAARRAWSDPTIELANR